MSDYSAKPSGSLALDYDMSSDDSDQEEHITLTSKSTHNSSVEMNECAVAEASPAESGVESGSEPATSSESKDPVPEDEPTEEEDEGAGRAVDVAEDTEQEGTNEEPKEQQEEDPDDTPEPSREESMEVTGNDQEQDQDESASSADESVDDDEQNEEKEKSKEPDVAEEDDVKKKDGEKEEDDDDDVKIIEKKDSDDAEEPETSEATKQEVDSDDIGNSDESKADTLDDMPAGNSKNRDDTSDDDSSDSDSNDDDDEEERDAGDEEDQEEKEEQQAAESSKKPEEEPEEEMEVDLEKSKEDPDDEPEDEPMDASVADTPEIKSNGVPATGESENPWETPKQSPVNGIVQPRVFPPEGKPTRHTNCLDFVLFNVVKDALKHKHSWPFQTPVDTNKLEIPEYHNIVSKPMDLRTIERRLRNLYYWSAADAIKDINQLFTSCYTYNPPEYDVYKMAKTLEKQVLSQLAELPSSDLNVLFDNCKMFNDRNDDIYIMCENIEGVVQRGLEWMPKQETPAELAEHHRRGMFPASTPSGKTKAPKPRGRKSTRGRKKASLPRTAAAAAPPKEEEVVDEAEDDNSYKVESVLNFDDDDNATEKDVESRAMSVQDDIEETKPSTSQAQTPAKGNKRKADNGDNGITIKVAVSESPSPAPVVPPTPTLAPRKNPNSMIDWKSLVPRWHGKQAEWQKFGAKILSEFHSVRNKSFAQIFYLPVDPIKLKIHDYLDIIKNPMDIQTMKKKFEYKQYAEPEEFVDDLNLMVNNCCTYNPKGSSVYQNALDVKSYFESRWAQCPLPGVQIEPPPALVVNVDLMEDEKINSYISAVTAEERKCAEKLESLRKMNEGLYMVALQRREAKLVGNTAPVLQDNQINQLDKLGITIKPIAPVMMVPEQSLISPAISVRSSGRAPVPKIIDDIGPSPIKSRKISKPRPSNASSISVAVVAPPPPSARGRKKKSGRPRKATISPSPTPPPVVQYHAPPPPVVTPYVSIYGRKTVSTRDKLSLSEKMANIPVDFITAVLRIMQIGSHNAGGSIRSIRSLCEDEIDFNEVPDDLVIELLDYLHMIKVDRTRAEIVKRELEAKAKIYGFDDVDAKAPLAKRRKLDLQPQTAPPRSESPSPSASRAGNRSSDSESDSSDSEPPTRENSPVRNVKTPVSGASSRASTPAGPSRAPVVAQPPVRTSKHALHASQNAVYPKRTLSESSSSSEGNSSDSSDSDSEPKHQIQKQPVPQKKKVLKKTAPPPKQRKPAPLSILDELLPDTPNVKPKMATIPSNVPYTRNMPPESISLQKTYSPPRVSEDQIRAQREMEHNEALQRQAEARRRRAMEEQPMVLQQEVMQAFESQYGDFTY